MLEFIEESAFVNDNVAVSSGQERGAGLMSCIREMWRTFSSSSCVVVLRLAFYYFLQDVCDHKATLCDHKCDHKATWPEGIIAELRNILVVGLSDSDETVRQSVFDWWNRQGLDKDPCRRFAQLFKMRPPHQSVLDEQWLGNAVSLLLQLCRDSSSNASKLFDQDLAVNREIFNEKRRAKMTSFTKCEISTLSQGAGSLPMTPMFASSLPFSQVAGSQRSMSLAAGSQSQRNNAGGRGDVMMTLYGSMQGSMQYASSQDAMKTLDSTRDYLANQTLQASDEHLFVPRRREVARPAGGAWAASSRMGGAFAKPRPKAPISKAGSDDSADRARFARLAEDRRAVEERRKQNRSKSVRMAREYR
jgi:hypothetical protein